MKTTLLVEKVWWEGLNRGWMETKPIAEGGGCEVVGARGALAERMSEKRQGAEWAKQ